MAHPLFIHIKLTSIQAKPVGLSGASEAAQCFNMKRMAAQPEL